MGVSGQRHDPAALPPERCGTHLYETAWVPGTVWTASENLAPPKGFDPRTVQPVPSRYTHYAIPDQ